MAWICRRCGSTFDEPEQETYCVEAYNGVASMFPNHHYAEYDVCPVCGNEDIARLYDEDDESEEDEEWED